MAWAPTDISSLAYWMPTFSPTHLWQEDSTIVGLTRATADADKVGQVDDPSPCAHRAIALSSATRPALGSSGSRLSFLTFTGASTNRLDVENSLSAFNFIHGGGAFSLCFWALMATDGTSMILLDSVQGTSANAGIYLEKTSGNKLALAIGRAPTASFMVNYTTTATFAIADGWLPITITVPAGAGTATGTITIGAKSPETFNVLAGAPAGTAAHANLEIGALSGTHGSPFNGSMSDLVIVNAVMSGADLTAFRAYNPARDGSSIVTASNTSAATLLPSQLNFLQYWYDFSDASHLWQDTANSVAVAVDTDPIRSAQNKSSALLLNRDAQANSTGTRPLYRTGIQNSLAAGKWDGVDDNLIFETDWQRGGAMTVFLVCNAPTINGHPHVMEASSTQYWTITGSTYATASSFVFHQSGGDSATVAIVNPDAWNIFELVRNGAITRVFVNGVEGQPLVSVGQSNMTQIGLANDGTLYWPGYVAEMVVYRAVHTDTNRSLVRAGLASKWGITNVKTLNAGGSSRGRSRVGG